MNVEINPFGTAYNPVSIYRCLERLATGRPFEEEELEEHPQDGRWFSFDHHTSFSARDPSKVLSNINSRLAQGHVSLKHAKHVFLTLGTAHAYVLLSKERKGREKGEKRVVANCHRLPATSFRRELLDIPKIVSSLQSAIQSIRVINTECTITFTVSPVRHLRNAAGDAIQSSRSKAQLLAAIHQVLDEDLLSPSSSPSVSPSSSPSSSLLSYFPAYEIMMDDLRDYRFYAPDMIHPSPVALEYIYSRFADAYLDFSPPSFLLRKDLETLRRNLQHRPLDRTSPAHQLFLKQQLIKMEGLQASWPHLDFEAERAVVRKGLVE
ncbi:gscfa family protein [Nannochloropsis oceanica]